MTTKIVVGFDSTPASTYALMWAAQAAHDRKASLELVHAIGHPMSALDEVFEESIREGAADLLAKGAALVHESWPEVAVETRVDSSAATRALTERSRRAALVVVGTERLSRMAQVLSGSLSYTVVAASRCPVVVVPRLPADDAGVVVGVDGSPDGVQAVALAAEEAERTGQDLHVVHAVQEPAAYLSADYLSPARSEAHIEAERVIVGESVAGVAVDHPDLRVHRHLVSGQPAAVLLDLAAHARLLVVGSHGRTGVARAVLGSVSHDLVLNASCPVMVVRVRDHGRPKHR